MPVLLTPVQDQGLSHAVLVEEMKLGKHHRKIEGANQDQESGFSLVWQRKVRAEPLTLDSGQDASTTSCWCYGDSENLRLPVPSAECYCPPAQQEHTALFPLF